VTYRAFPAMPRNRTLRAGCGLIELHGLCDKETRERRQEKER
jgi:hypothetical protein